MGESIVGLAILAGIILIGLLGTALRVVLGFVASLLSSPVRLLYFLIGAFTGGLFLNDGDSCNDCDFDDL
ncbi:MAG: hypothetical protein HOF21_07685 [Nitrospina sp.]|jgi:hypothetical protein|nr:hypothetical protein [Nitrospina sp.]MBT5633026.1 hypothetical protein [Nitrospina sp.]